MKVLFLSNIPSPYQIDLINEMNKYCEFYGCFLHKTEKDRDWKSNLTGNKQIIILNHKNKFTDYLKYYKILSRIKPDVIIIGGYSLPLSLFSLFFTKVFSKQSIFWLERPINSYGKHKEKLKKLYLTAVLGSASKIFAIGKTAQDYYIQFNKTIYNIPYSMYLQQFYKIEREPKDKIRFLFSGQYIDRKNIINLIQAFKNIPTKNIELNLLGSGELKEQVQRMIQTDKRINILGFVQPKNLPNIYAQNDIFILPSKHDGWALVINEAMAAAMPIISTKHVGAMVEFIKHKDNGYICDIDVKSIMESISFYSTNYEMILKHGKRNRSIIKESLGDSKNIAKEIYRILEENNE